MANTWTTTWSQLAGDRFSDNYDQLPVTPACNTAVISKERCFCVEMYDWLCSRLPHIQARPSLQPRDTQFTTILIVKNVPLFKTAAGQRSFQYRVVSLWNGLDEDLKFKSEVLLKSKNHRDFKQKLRQILLYKFLDPASVS